MIAHQDLSIAAKGGDDVLARTIFAEARGEFTDGQVAVAYTVKHRAEIAARYVLEHDKPHPLFGDGTIADACLSSFHGIHQYSCWNMGDPSLAKALAADHSNPAFCRACEIARQVIAGTVPDALPDTTHYFNPRVVAEPAWAKGLPYHSIGRHRFFRNVP
jgi:hypothetical protein